MNFYGYDPMRDRAQFDYGAVQRGIENVGTALYKYGEDKQLKEAKEQLKVQAAKDAKIVDLTHQALREEAVANLMEAGVEMDKAESMARMWYLPKMPDEDIDHAVDRWAKVTDKRLMPTIEKYKSQREATEFGTKVRGGQTIVPPTQRVDQVGREEPRAMPAGRRGGESAVPAFEPISMPESGARTLPMGRSEIQQTYGEMSTGGQKVAKPAYESALADAKQREQAAGRGRLQEFAGGFGGETQEQFRRGATQLPEYREGAVTTEQIEEFEKGYPAQRDIAMQEYRAAMQRLSATQAGQPKYSDVSAVYDDLSAVNRQKYRLEGELKSLKDELASIKKWGGEDPRIPDIETKITQKTNEVKKVSDQAKAFEVLARKMDQAGGYHRGMIGESIEDAPRDTVTSREPAPAPRVQQEDEDGGWLDWLPFGRRRAQQSQQTQQKGSLY